MVPNMSNVSQLLVLCQCSLIHFFRNISFEICIFDGSVYVKRNLIIGDIPVFINIVFMKISCDIHVMITLYVLLII